MVKFKSDGSECEKKDVDVKVCGEVKSQTTAFLQQKDDFPTARHKTSKHETNRNHENTSCSDTMILF